VFGPERGRESGVLVRGKERNNPPRASQAFYNDIAHKFSAHVSSEFVEIQWLKLATAAVVRGAWPHGTSYPPSGYLSII
jgi:hypothetical protein